MRDLLPKIEYLPWPFLLPVVLLTLAFIVLQFWVWSSSRSREFDLAARLPLEADGGESGQNIAHPGT